jgi:transglutaminase-like putative cysteine protease
MAADCVTAATVALLALDALRPRATLLGVALVALGAIVPRLAAELVEGPRALFRRGFRLTPASLPAAIALLLALVVGFRALDVVPNLAAGIGFEMILLAMCWIAGFGLRDPAAYVVYEPLALGTALFSLVRGASHAVPLVAAVFLAMCVSGALRRQLAESSDPERKGRVNVRSARLLGALAALLLVIVFALSNAGLAPVLARSRSPAAGGPDRETRPPPARSRAGESEGRGSSGGAGDPGRAADGARVHGGVDGIAPPSLRAGARPLGEEGAGEVLLEVTPPSSGPESVEPDALPHSLTLWRARTYVRFDAAKQEWTDEGPERWSPPAAAGRSIRREAPPGGSRTTWEATLVTPRFDCLLLPYATHEIAVETEGAAANLLANSRGDLVWVKLGLRVKPTYWITLEPLRASGVERAPGLAAAKPSSEDELQTPGARAAGVSLRAVAREAMGPESGALAAKIEGLRSWFRKSFRYAKPSDAELPAGIGEFLRSRRVGTCEHFATAAALLLRASGVPTRLVCGFAGTTRDWASGAYVVRSGDAHAWIEVATNAGWMPLDPTAWVKSVESLGGDPGGVPESEPVVPRPRPPGWLALAIIGAALAVSLVAFLARRRREGPRDAREPEEPAPAEAAPVAPPFLPRTPAEHLLVDYGRLQEDLSATGQERRTHETPREHARRVSDPAREKVDQAFESLIPMIDDGLYGHLDLTEADLARGRRDLGEIRRGLG